MSFFVGFKGSDLFKLNNVLIKDKNIANTFENAVASFALSWKNNKVKGTVMVPPEIPEMEPIPDNRVISNIPINSIPWVIKQCF